MRITNVDAFLMSCPLPEPVKLPFWGGERTILKRDAMLIRISTDAGLTGYGPGPASGQARGEILGAARPHLLGRDPARWPDLRPLAGAAEIALLDLAGKIEQRPVSELIGGRLRERIRLYGSAGMYMSPREYAEEAAAIIEQGFSAYKMRPGIGPEADVEAVRLMRRAVGSDADLMIDAHTWWRMGDRSYSYDTVAQVYRDLAVYRPVILSRWPRRSWLNRCGSSAAN